MDNQDKQDQPVEAKPKRDKGKMVFLAVAIVAVVLVYISQQSGSELPDWSDDLPAALAQAEKEKRGVLVFFVGDPPSANGRWMATSTLPKNAKKIAELKLLKVLLQVNMKDERIKQYKITRLPAFLLLNSQGEELNRREGRVGEVPFKKQFLDRGTVEKPKGE